MINQYIKRSDVVYSLLRKSTKNSIGWMSGDTLSKKTSIKFQKIIKRTATIDS